MRGDKVSDGASEDAIFRIIAESSGAAFALSTASLICHASPGFVRLTGYSAEELRGMGFTSLAHPDFHDLIESRWRQNLSGDPTSSRDEVPLVTKSGRVFWADLATAGAEYR